MGDVRVPSFKDLDALPTLPLITFGFEAWCQSQRKSCSI